MIKENWPQIVFFVLFVISFTTLELKSESNSQEIKENSKYIEQIAKFLNDEDDGVRSDFETADKNIREYEDMRERALKAEILLEIEKSKN